VIHLFSDTDQRLLHVHCTANKEALHHAAKCGCFYCLRIFDPGSIDEWMDDKDGKTAVCPHCGIDSVIPDTASAGFGKELLIAMNGYWF
jgi:hypothetical protein